METPLQISPIFASMSDQPHIIIIGGGAAGFFAAANCAQTQPNARITILEKSKRILEKVKISGGGRCNLTHACWTPRELIAHYPRGGKELLGPFHTFCTGDTVGWFGDRGVETKIEEDGRMFPVTDSSMTVVECLVNEAGNAGVKVLTSHRVSGLVPPEHPGGKWAVVFPDKPAMYADKVMMATGSSPQVWKMLERLGLKIVEPVPSLFTFNIKDKRIEGLAGISVPMAEVRILGTRFKESGPLLITHWGMSGPAVLKLSAWAARELNQKDYDFRIAINWAAGMPVERIREELEAFKAANPRKQVGTQNPFGLPGRLWHAFIQAAGLKREGNWAETGKKGLDKCSREIGFGEFQVKGKSTFKEEFVTAGGVDLKEINFKRFESKKHPGLFLAGEVLNIDAVTGGFNFQAAWTGGYVGGLAMSEG